MRLVVPQVGRRCRRFQFADFSLRRFDVEDFLHIGQCRHDRGDTVIGFKGGHEGQDYGSAASLTDVVQSPRGFHHDERFDRPKGGPDGCLQHCRDRR